eukprot:7327517-Lingulodinium_polyedra.AAC.1
MAASRTGSMNWKDRQSCWFASPARIETPPERVAQTVKTWVSPSRSRHSSVKETLNLPSTVFWK